MHAPHDEAVIQCAAEILSHQLTVPPSPARIGADGRPELCLAAAVAVAGFITRGEPLEAERLVHDLVQTRSKSRLRRAFLALGWTAEDCDTRLEFNDSRDDNERKEEIVAFLARR